MTLEEAIQHAEEVAEENQRVVDTHIVFDDVTIDMLYCDDTEVIDEHLANYQMCAEEHRQLAEWLKELKTLKEQTIPLSVIDEIKANIEGLIKTYERNYGKDLGMIFGLKNSLDIIDEKVKEYRE